MLPYELTSAAASDLRDIARHTLSRWGRRQQQRYARQLATCCQAIGDGSTVSRTFSEHHPSVYVMRCQHHYVFFLTPTGGKPVIIAFLHERMDLTARLQRRLTP
ncbi:MAG: type II toxin-antitoxin system RelE/ParE family toxin [Deltaproteobacteria bacterium]|nr:type II toxin-antitoxin system RelE/ParE family toxin [Deltaproteobacteria bacterium]